MGMIQDILQDLHPILVHFPLALLVVSVGMSWAVKVRPGWGQLDFTSWITLVIGAVMAIPAVVTGFLAHIPYEQTPLIEVIETHQVSAILTTFLFVLLTLWRGYARQNGQDIGRSWLYLGLVTVGLGLIVFVGMTGGDLVYDYAINVRGVNPLLNP